MELDDLAEFGRFYQARIEFCSAFLQLASSKTRANYQGVVSAFCLAMLPN